tara:strand:- start:222 stop:536 length:315 start_codon:yes stop_codon:yes gene_type:complete
VEVQGWFKLYLHLLLSVDQEEETVDSVHQVVQELLIKVLQEEQTTLMIIPLQVVVEQQQQVQHLQAQVFQEQVEQALHHLLQVLLSLEQVVGVVVEEETELNKS